MRKISKSKLIQLTTVDLVTETDVLEIHSYGRIVGYFVPASTWHTLERVLAGAEGPGVDEARAIVGEGEDGS